MNSGPSQRALEETLYRRLRLRGSVQVPELANFLDVSEGYVVDICANLRDRGLIETQGETVRVVPWWETPRLSLRLEPNWLPDAEFDAYCAQLDDAVRRWRDACFPIVRPHLNEVGLEWLLAGAAAAGALVAGGLFTELGKKLVDFAEQVFTKRKDPSEKQVVTRIRIRGVHRLKTGQVIVLDVQGSAPEEIADAWAKLTDRLPPPGHVSSQRVEGHGWKLVVSDED